MGLPLYIAPVESDIKGKARPKSPAHARTSIRHLRLRQRGNAQRDRESQRRALAAVAAYQDGAESLAMPTLSGPASPRSNDDGHNDDTRQRLREMIGGRMGAMDALDDRVVAMFGERWANLHARSNPAPLLDDARDSRDSQHPSSSTRHAPDGPLDEVPEQWNPADDPSSLRESSRRSVGLLPRSPPPLRRVGSRDLFELYNRRINRSERVRRQTRFADVMEREGTRRYAGTRFDGLGDRDRSLSPEGDGVWDTLLTTLTPDPQPPSLGSSFASTSASVAASQGPAPESSNTSFAPDTGAEATLPEPCDSGCENSDTDGDDDYDLAHQSFLTRYPSGLRNSRSYANVVAQPSGNDDTFEVLGGIGGMQRIVRNLARREDIPDEWWAEAGLSRTLSRDGSD